MAFPLSSLSSERSGFSIDAVSTLSGLKGRRFQVGCGIFQHLEIMMEFVREPMGGFANEKIVELKVHNL